MARNVLSHEEIFKLVDFLKKHKEEIDGKMPVHEVFSLIAESRELQFPLSLYNVKNMMKTLRISPRGRAQIVDYSSGLANDLMTITDCLLEIYQGTGSTSSTTRQNLLTLRDTLRRKNDTI